MNGSSLPEEELIIAENPFLSEDSEPWGVIVLILCILGGILNSLVVLLFVCDSHLRKHPPNVLAASLAIADLLLTITYLVLEHAHIIRPAQYNIEWTLAIDPVIFVCLIASQLSSVLHVMLLTLDRFIAIIHPLKYLRWQTGTRKRLLKLLLICVFIWIFSLGFGSLWSWNVIITGYVNLTNATNESLIESRDRAFEEMSTANNLWTLANNFILLSVLCSTMALYAPILKAILKAKKVAQERHKRAASIRLFNSAHEVARQRNLCRSHSDSNFVTSSHTKEMSTWKASRLKAIKPGLLSVANLETHRSNSFRHFHEPVHLNPNLTRNTAPFENGPALVNLQEEHLVMEESLKVETNLNCFQLPTPTFNVESPAESENKVSENLNGNIVRTVSFRLFYPSDNEDASNTKQSDPLRSINDFPKTLLSKPPIFNIESHDTLQDLESASSSTSRSLNKLGNSRTVYTSFPGRSSENGVSFNTNDIEAGNPTSILNVDNLEGGKSIGDTSPTPLIRKSSFKKPVVENGDPNATPKALRQVSLNETPIKSALNGKSATHNIASLRNSESTVNVWRKLNAIRVESCVSLSKQFSSRSTLNLTSIKPLFRVQLQGATTIFIIVACLWVGYLPDALLSITHCFKYIANEMYNVVYSVCAVLKVISAVTNPIVYCLRTEGYRLAFERLTSMVIRNVRELCCCSVKSIYN